MSRYDKDIITNGCETTLPAACFELLCVGTQSVSCFPTEEGRPSLQRRAKNWGRLDLKIQEETLFFSNTYGVALEKLRVQENIAIPVYTSSSVPYMLLPFTGIPNFVYPFSHAPFTRAYVTPPLPAAPQPTPTPDSRFPSEEGNRS